MQKEKVGVLFIDKTPKTTRDGNIYLTGIPEGDENHVLIAYENTSPKGFKYYAIYKVEKDPRYQKGAKGSSEGDSAFSDQSPDDEQMDIEDLPF